jgi:hypothetical protein
MTAGAVVMVGGEAEITETTSDLSDQVFGVISDQPAYAMNAGAGNSESHPYVAMTGRTPVRVTGAVTKGQRLVSSSTKGCARAAATGESYSPFHVIGRALELSDPIWSVTYLLYFYCSGCSSIPCVDSLASTRTRSNSIRSVPHLILV